MAAFLMPPVHRSSELVDSMINGSVSARGWLEAQFKMAEHFDKTVDLLATAAWQIPNDERQVVVHALAAVKAECEAVQEMLGPAFKDGPDGKYVIKIDTDTSQPKRAAQLVRAAIDRLVAAQLSELARGAEERVNILKPPDPAAILLAVTVFNNGIRDFARRVMDANDRANLNALYTPLEKAGYTILAAASRWKLPTPRLSELLEKCRLVGIPLAADFAVHAHNYDQARDQAISHFLDELAQEIAAVKHQASLEYAAGRIIPQILTPKIIAPEVLDILNGGLVILQKLRLAERETHAPISGGGEEWHFDNPGDEYRVRAAQREIKSLNAELRVCFGEIAANAMADEWDVSPLASVLDCPPNHIAMLPALIDDAEICLRGILSRSQATSAAAPLGESAKTSERLSSVVPEIGNFKGRRGRLGKDESSIKKANMLDLIREHTSLRDDPAKLAKMVEVSESTVRRWLDDEEQKFLKSRAANPAPPEE